MTAADRLTEALNFAIEAFAREEQGHEARLRRIQAKGMRPAGNPQVQDLKIADYQVKMELRPDMTYRELLMLAMQKELAANRLYTALADTTSDAKLSRIFRQLAQEEARHKLKFETEYDNLMVEG
jgi:rubrerythrin